LKAKPLKMWNQKTIATFHRLLVLLLETRLQTKNVIKNTTDCQTSCRWLSDPRAAQKIRARYSRPTYIAVVLFQRRATDSQYSQRRWLDGVANTKTTRNKTAVSDRLKEKTN
jgi:hypothetical protein